MSTLDALLVRNRTFAEQQAAAGNLMPSLKQAIPSIKAIVLGCGDMRVDPADVLGLKPGEALVIRNIGGRVTPSVMAELKMLGRIGQVAGAVPGGGGDFHLIVLHHTDCGITRLTGDPALLAPYFGVAEAALRGKSVDDPYAAVASDVAALRAAKALPQPWILSGLVYDVATGLVATVVPPAPNGDA